MIVEAITLLVFPALMAIAAVSDLLTMTISNKVSLTLVAGFFLLAVATGMSLNEIASHLAAGGIILVVAFVFFARGWIGGGDAKLAAATALWFGFDQLLPYIFDAALFGGALTLLLLQFRVVRLPARVKDWGWAARLHKVDGGVPYGIALAIAALAVYPDTLWMKALAH